MRKRSSILVGVFLAFASLGHADPRVSVKTDYLVLLETIGIATIGDVMAPLISKESGVPATYSMTNSTGADGQTEILLKFFAGPHPQASENRCITFLKITGFTQTLRGQPQVVVNISIARDGHLKFAAKEIYPLMRNVSLEHLSCLPQDEETPWYKRPAKIFRNDN